MTTRNEAIEIARGAAWNAKNFAQHTESAARSGDPNRHTQTERLAQASAAWADTSRAYSALAALLPEADQEQDTTDA